MTHKMFTAPDLPVGSMKAKVLGCECVGTQHLSTCAMRQWIEQQQDKLISLSKY